MEYKCVTYINKEQTENTAVRCVWNSLLIRFIPENIGADSICRREFIDVLYNSQPQIPKAIVAIYSTYAYIPKSSNFHALC